MPSLVSARVDRASGWTALRFAYSASTIAFLKTLPGPRWDPASKCWMVPNDLLGVINEALPLNFTVVQRMAAVDVDLLSASPDGRLHLRPYQIEAAEHCLYNGRCLVSMDMRLGKTPSLCRVLDIDINSAKLNGGKPNVGVVIYPASVQQVWKREFKRWSNLDFVPLESKGKKRSKKQPAIVLPTPYNGLVIGLHYEIVEGWVGKAIEHIDENGVKYITHDLGPLTEFARDSNVRLVLDEVQFCQNRKSKRYTAIRELSKSSVSCWGLSGTPMRNRNRDLYGTLDVINPNCFGQSYWKKFAARYTNAFIDDFGHWDDSGESNSDELRSRVSSISYRKTRSEVANFLPKSQRSIVLCDLGKEDSKSYATVAKMFAKQIGAAIEDPDRVSSGGRAALESLIAVTTRAKVPVLISRIREHMKAGHKVVVFSHMHETTDQIIAALEKEHDIPYRWIDGRVTKEERFKIIDAWKSDPNPNPLLAGTLAAGIGIDLSDAEAAIFTELEWVPADFRQAEDRIVDVHQGKRNSSPLYEYIICRNTVDEPMIRAILSKLRDIERVIGPDSESKDMQSTLGGESKVLDTNDIDVVRTSLRSARDRMLNAGALDEPDAGFNQGSRCKPPAADAAVAGELASLAAVVMAEDWTDLEDSHGQS